MNIEFFSENPEHARWGLPGTILWSIVILVAYIFSQVIAMGAYLGYVHGGVAPAEYETMMNDLQFNGTVLAICTFASFIVCGFILLAAIKFKRDASVKHYLGFRIPSFSECKYWFLIIVVLIIFSDSLTYFLGKEIVPEFMTSVYESADPIWLLWIALIIAAPVFEEIFFRGFLLSGLAHTFVKPLGAIFISALLWSVIHVQYDIYGMATIFVMGLVLGTARLITGSVLLTIGLHSFMNLIATIETVIYLS